MREKRQTIKNTVYLALLLAMLLAGALLGRYQSFSDQDVLFLYSASVLNHSETLK